MSDNLKEVLDLVPESDSKEITTFVPKDVKDITNRGDDYETVIENLHTLVKDGMEILEGIKGMAEQSQHPRFYEMVATHINAMVMANKAILEATKTQQSIDAADAAAEEPAIEKGGKHVTNNLFIGSTTELLEMMKRAKDEVSG